MSIGMTIAVRVGEMMEVCSICGAKVIRRNEDGSVEMEPHYSMCAGGIYGFVNLRTVPADWVRPTADEFDPPPSKEELAKVRRWMDEQRKLKVTV